MKFIWEEKDIQGGVRYGRADISTHWMITWSVCESLENLYAGTSLADGYTTDPMTAEEMASKLNKDVYVPLKFMGGLL